MARQGSPPRKGRRVSNVLWWPSFVMINTRHNWIIPKRPMCQIVESDPNFISSTESRYDTDSALITISLVITSLHFSLCTRHSLYTYSIPLSTHSPLNSTPALHLTLHPLHFSLHTTPHSAPTPHVNLLLTIPKSLIFVLLIEIFKYSLSTLVPCHSYSV